MASLSVYPSAHSNSSKFSQIHMKLICVMEVYHGMLDIEIEVLVLTVHFIELFKRSTLHYDVWRKKIAADFNDIALF